MYCWLKDLENNVKDTGPSCCYKFTMKLWLLPLNTFKTLHNSVHQSYVVLYNSSSHLMQKCMVFQFSVKECLLSAA